MQWFCSHKIKILLCTQQKITEGIQVDIILSFLKVLGLYSEYNVLINIMKHCPNLCCHIPMFLQSGGVINMSWTILIMMVTLLPRWEVALIQPSDHWPCVKSCLVGGRQIQLPKLEVFIYITLTIILILVVTSPMFLRCNYIETWTNKMGLKVNNCNVTSKIWIIIIVIKHF